MSDTPDKLQWHPAFFASMQIELEAESDNLIFKNEHQLGTKPKEIDVLIIKKESSVPVRKNIGRIFRKYNIIEYKSPTDYLSIDDYYKVYGYACFYKSDAIKQNSIPIREITLTFVCKNYPKKLIRHLRDERFYIIEKQENGIYLVHGNVFPIQIIVTKELSPQENLWLHSLTDDIEDVQAASKLVHAYEAHHKNILYESVMDIIVRANYHKFEEVDGMCKALIELMQPYIDEQIEKGIEAAEKKMKEAERKATEQRIKQGIEQGIVQGIEQGIMQGENRVNQLNNLLMKAGRTEDIFKAMVNGEYQKELFVEFNI